MLWAIYYDDGRTFTSGDGEWCEAPCDGVLFIIERRGDRVITHSGADYYPMIDGDVAATNDLGPILRKLGFVKFGRWTSHKRYEEIGRRVAQDAKAWQR